MDDVLDLQLFDDFAVVDFSKDCFSPLRLTLADAVTGFLVDVIVPCHKRFDRDCPSCASRFRRKVFAQANDFLDSCDFPRFLTLTLVIDADGSADNFGLMWRLFWDFRRRMENDGFTLGRWFAVFEFPNHIHCVFDGDFLPKGLVSDNWKAVTGESFIVDIKAFDEQRARKMVARYISKYVSKMKLPNDAVLPRNFRIYNHSPLGWDGHVRRRLSFYVPSIESYVGCQGFRRIDPYSDVPPAPVRPPPCPLPPYTLPPLDVGEGRFAPIPDYSKHKPWIVKRKWPEIPWYHWLCWSVKH